MTVRKCRYKEKNKSRQNAAHISGRGLGESLSLNLLVSKSELTNGILVFVATKLRINLPSAQQR